MNEVKYCFVIDPWKKDIRVVDLPENKLELFTIYELLDCGTFDVHSLTADTDLFVKIDFAYDNGLLVEEQRFFSIDNKVFAGNGLIVGAVNEEGHSTTPTYPDDFLPVTFMPKSYQMEITADDLKIEVTPNQYSEKQIRAGETPVDVQLYVDEPIRRSDDTTYEET